MANKMKRREKPDVNSDGFVLDTKNPTHFTEKQFDLNDQTKSRGRILLIGIILILLGLVLVAVIGFSWFATRFREESGHSFSSLMSQISNGVQKNPFADGEQ